MFMKCPRDYTWMSENQANFPSAQKRKFKSDGQEKSTKILISWQELKNKFLSFFVHRQLLVDKKPNVDCSRQKAIICEKN